MSDSKDLSGIFIIFGGTGDLTHRKLLPAMFNLKHESMLPEKFAVVSVGRQVKTTEEYRNDIKESIRSYSRFYLDKVNCEELMERVYYYRVDFNEDEGYIGLKEFLNNLDEKYDTASNRIYYLSVSPEYFGVIVSKLKNHGLAEENVGFKRVVIEKPFGRDLKSARELNLEITGVFNEKNIYRIDHYLGKEMIQNIMVLRFANAFFEPIWNNRFIDNIQISSTEVVGVEGRGGYYEKSGAMRDMVQNHMLQLLTLTAMEPPVNLETESIRDEKVKVLRSLEQFTPELAVQNTVRGQYAGGNVEEKILGGYREEERVSSDSNTETFVAIKTCVENFRWSGVPFYIRTGKRMPVKSTEIVIEFKPLPEILYFKEYGILQPNLLVIKVQPEEGIFLQFNAKRPGTTNFIMPVAMDFCQNCQRGSNSPEAYERLIYDVLRGDPTLFTRWDELENSWRFVDNIAAAWRENPHIPLYASGTWGPEEAISLMKRDNRAWWNVNKGMPEHT